MKQFAQASIGWTAVTLLGAGFVLAAESPDRAPEADAFFEARIRPLLVARCLSCHGSGKQESGLRVDSRDGLLKGGDGGVVVVPGRPDQSRLVAAVSYQGELHMPPNGRLNGEEVAALSNWIALGMPWPSAAPPLDDVLARGRSHWAFQPLRKPSLPPIRDVAWSRTPLDRFIGAGLEEVGVSPSPEADRRTLIRRVFFDLLGLPPTPTDVDAFVNDPSPDAYERLIDRLLASPAYGERWARHWLDVARYADNKGYVFFEDAKYPWAYTYRDYVIDAFNDDLPYDRFVVEQLAADQLDLRDDLKPLRAMGFLTLGAHFMNNTHDILDDRIDVVTRGLLGLTVTCARCHDHKYDPIPQADYYGLYGVFRSSYEPTVPPLFEPPPATEEYRKFAEELGRREQALVEFVTGRHRELVADARRRIADYLRAAQAQRGQPPADDFMLLTDKGDLNPTMILRWQLYLEDPRSTHDRIWAPWRRLADVAAAEFSERVPAVLAAEPDLNPLVRAALSQERAGSMEELAEIYGQLLRAIEEKWSAFAAQAEAGGQPRPSRLPEDDEEELRQVLYGPDAPADAPLSLDWGFLSLFPDRPTQEEYKKLLKAVEEWLVSASAPPRAMVLYDAETPTDPRIFHRGQPNRLGPYVTRKFLALLDDEETPFTRGSGRLELAEAIVARNNPLTVRVLVNRVWLHHFGRGLVATPSDFGLRSDPPTHPQLLDYLAATFMEQGWSLKELHRAILLSATYRQQSLDRPEGIAADPENRLLWRMNRRRLDFESQRDAMLAVSGSLSSELHGPALELFDTPTVQPRRSIYGFINRMDVSPLLTTFDFPNPNVSSPQRIATTVSPQALYLMNSPFVAECATRLAARVATGDVPSRLRDLYRLALGREPAAEEMVLAVDYLGDEPAAEQWCRYAHGLLMSNEFSFID